MYADPTKIRSHVVKIRLNDEEVQLIDSLMRYTGEQKAAFLREIIIENANKIIHSDDYAAAA